MAGKSLVLGFFDGVHLAHRKVLQASQNPIVLSFEESPAKFFGYQVDYILSRNNSVNKLKSLGVEQVYLFDFSEIANMSAEEYLSYIITKYSPTEIVTGFNHTFGFNRIGNPSFLKTMQKKYNYNYICVPEQYYDGEIVSSSAIRNYLRNGNIVKANSMLESNFILEGKVVKGVQLGTKLGFPTANIQYPSELVKLPYGVYKVKTLNSMSAIMNWGIKPTINDTLIPIIEVHIPHFSGNLYNQTIKIEVINKLRDEIKFNTIDELKSQIEKDVMLCSEL